MFRGQETIKDPFASDCFLYFCNVYFSFVCIFLKKVRFKIRMKILQKYQTIYIYTIGWVILYEVKQVLIKDGDLSIDY